MLMNKKNYLKNVISFKLRDELTEKNIEKLHKLIDEFNECNEEEVIIVND